MFPKTTLHCLILLLSMLFWMPTLAAQNSSKSDTTYAKKLLAEVKEMFAKEQSEGALEKLNTAAEIFERVLGKENLHYADALHQLAQLELIKNDLDKGIALIHKVLDIKLKILGLYHLDVASLYNNLSYAFKQKDDIDHAIENKQKALEIRSQVLGKDHPDVILTAKNLAALYATHYYYKALEAYEANELQTAITQAQRSDSIYLDQKNYWWVLQIRILLTQFYSAIGKPQSVIQTYETSRPIIQLAGQTDSLLEAKLLNSYASSLLDLNQFDQAERMYQRVIQIKQKIYSANTTEIGMETSNLANLYFKKGQYKKAIQLANIGIKMREKGISPNPSLLRAYTNLGGMYDGAGFYRDAATYLDKAHQIIRSNPTQYQKQAGMLYQSMANLQHNLGDFDKAAEYNQLAKLSYISAFDSSHPQISNLDFNLGLLAIDKADWSAVIHHTRQAIRALQQNKKNRAPQLLIDSYEQMSDGFLKINLDSSLHYANLAFQLCESLTPDDEYANANTRAHLGLVYAELNRFKAADSLMLVGVRKVQQVFGNKHVMTGLFLDNRANILTRSGDYATALATYDDALQAYGYTEGARWDTLVNTYQMLSTLQKRNRVLLRWYQQEKNETTLATIAHRFAEIQDLLTYLRRHYQGQETKLTFAAQFKEAAEDAIGFYQSLSTPKAAEQAWAFAEKSRSLAVLEAFQNTKAWQFKGVSDLKTTEESFIASSKKWTKAYEVAETIAEKDSCYRLLMETRVNHESWLKELEKQNPKFYDLKYGQDTMDIQSVKNLLGDQQTLLEYFVGDSSVYIFLIQPKHHELVVVKKEAEFEQWIVDMTRNGIYGYYAAPRNIQNPILREKTLKNYTSSAYKLYETLIAPVKSKLSEKIIIIPDGGLGYLPFEALLTQNPLRPDAITSYQYLLKDHQVSYCYSAALLREMHDKQHSQEPTQKLLAMAPFYFTNSTTGLTQTDSPRSSGGHDFLSALPHSGPEIAAISKLLNGQAFFGREATLNKFQELASRYRILHLSTHGEADDRLGDYAYLAFGMPNVQGVFDKLYARDLYNLSLNADLVVLSACETGIGKLQAGEGIVSLARAFTYAGAKSMITTLWKVKDERSKEIMISFYQYLKNGKDKDEALRQAKLDFLQKNAKDTVLLHPFFWASFIGVGNMDSIQ